MGAMNRESLQAFFEVAVSHVRAVRLARRTLVEQALTKPQGIGCETNDQCLRFVATATDSVYSVYAQVIPDAAGLEMLVSARVVRSDGVIVRKLSLNAPLVGDMTVTETGRELVGVLVKSLELSTLPAITIPLQPPAQVPAGAQP